MDTTTQSSTGPHPHPYLFGMALSFDQLNMLAIHLLGDDFVQRICLGDPAYAFDQAWEADGIDNMIVEIPGNDGTIRYLYVLNVLPSFDGKPPPASLNPELVTKIWCELGKPDIWKKISTANTMWPGYRGIPGAL